MSEFKLPPISTLAGATLRSYYRVLRGGRIASRSWTMVVLTGLVVLINVPFRLWERVAFRRKVRAHRMAHPPLFILGHWRSGTTLLHNVLCASPDAAFVNTYQSLFPNNLASTWLFKTFMRMNMPDKRPSDNVALHIDFPQEDEFAFGNMQCHAYYNFFYFPSGYDRYYREAVHHEGLGAGAKKGWYEAYAELLTKALIVSTGSQLIVKNPVNTARIDKLLTLYPDAKFLYIHRNPVTVFFSTHRFFHQLMPTLCFEELPSEAFLDDMILDVYDRLMSDYAAQRSRIPPENLMEISFEAFERSPLPHLERIERDLMKRDPGAQMPHYSAYMATQKSHRMNTYEVEQERLDRVLQRLSKHMIAHAYELPENVRVMATKDQAIERTA